MCDWDTKLLTVSKILLLIIYTTTIAIHFSISTFSFCSFITLLIVLLNEKMASHHLSILTISLPVYKTLSKHLAKLG